MGIMAWIPSEVVVVLVDDGAEAVVESKKERTVYLILQLVRTTNLPTFPAQ